MNTTKNRLANETSPYLQQHADNPVDWYPWGERALQTARKQDKPILLSIGYSACHWCHVMAHESFEDENTAEMMNRLFVNIKIDREERPDLDKIYQTAQALLTQRTGGWPLTMFLTPEDQVPFFGGTYFPKEARHGLPSFTDLMQRVEQFFRSHRDEIQQQNASMKAALAKIYGTRATSGIIDPTAIEHAQRQLERSFDARYGGFGAAPKFPHPTNIELLLRRWADTRQENNSDQRALHMVKFTLTQMAQGGIYDHLGGGFCRYSVDDQWMIPHFEKMLYDNGPLLSLYSEVAVASGNALFAQTAMETAEWVMREMQSPEGGFYSTLDADSEGEEGKYYVWSPKQVEGLLDEKKYALFAHRFGLDGAANFEGKWHLHAVTDAQHLAKKFTVSEDEVGAQLKQARQILFSAREQRIRPGRDEKILTSWNGLMIKGMASAGRHFNNPAYLEAASRAIDFVAATLWKNDRLLATYKDGKAHLNAYLDDYAFLIDGILELLQANWRTQDLQFACALADTLIKHFEDSEHGGFYFTSDDHEALLERPKVFADEATPAGNGIAASALMRLGCLVGETRYLDAAARTLDSAAAAVNESPVAHASLLIAHQQHQHPPELLILRGSPPTLDKWQQRSVRGYTPWRLSFAIPAAEEDLPKALAEKVPHGDVVAYHCKGMTCSAPITTLKDFDAVLDE